MSIFLTQEEKQRIFQELEAGNPLFNRFYAALTQRVKQRAASPGVLDAAADVQWWYPAAEYLSDAAMVYALAPDETLTAWLKDVTLSIIRRPLADWIGPWFRDHATSPSLGHLETAHLCWGISTVLDLAKEIFTKEEITEIKTGLHEKGLVLCQRWLEHHTHLANWRGIMASGMAVSAVALEDQSSLAFAIKEIKQCYQAFQPDGSYAESLQYGNYLTYALTLAYEAIYRKYPPLSAQLDVPAYTKGIPWVVASMLYAKPLSGWGTQSRARAVNFNDSAVTFRPSGDILLHIASRMQALLPKEAGLARWLFDTYYVPESTLPPHHLASFGFWNDWGFLTLPLLGHTAPPLSPEEAHLPEVAGFSNGNIFLRDHWKGKTVVAIQGGSEPLYGPGHLHGDLNSFILVHQKERLLADPGHSCYRNLIHGLESASQTHNTCTFLIAQDTLGLQEDLAKSQLLEQSSIVGRRKIQNGEVGPPISSRGKRLLLSKKGRLTATGTEAGTLYGNPIESFSRFWLFLEPHILFVIDRITASEPVTTVWNWLLNNRDFSSLVEVHAPHHLTFQRNGVGLSIFHGGDSQLNGPIYGYVHDAYHPEPNRPGEGKPGSGLLYRWTEKQPRKTRCRVHAFAFDHTEWMDLWKFENTDASYILRKRDEYCSIHLKDDQHLSIQIETNENLRWHLTEKNQTFSFTQL